MSRAKRRGCQEHLIIPDSHAKPGESNRRFKWLGEYIIEHQPDVIIDIGDSADMSSLGKYDVGKVCAEGRRYVDDIASYHDAQKKIMCAMDRYNNTHTKWKKKTYRPKLVKCRGNHEYRIERAAGETPSLFGHISYEDLQEEKFGWEVHPFLKPVNIDNICYKHYFTSGVMGRAIGGINHARSIVSKAYMSSVCGHSHMRDFWEDTDACGRKVFGLVVGCFFEHDEHYTTENDRFWRGIVHLRGVCNGQAEPEFLSMDCLKQEYS